MIAYQRYADSGIEVGVARPLGGPLQDIRRTTARNFALGVGLAILALVGVLPLSRRMTRHLDTLTEGAARLGRGDLDVRVPVPRSAEFARLAETFNRMAGDLKRNQEQLVAQERLRKELEIGRRIQKELLPRGAAALPRSPRSAGSRSPRGRWGVTSSTTSPCARARWRCCWETSRAKGVPAALLMASLQATLRARLALEPDLARLVDALDREMDSGAPLSAYVTLFLAVLEGDDGARCATSTPGTTPSS